ncbi:hypothetical protein HDF19_03180 [Mucilaginibacter sp. E4BP6]|uniref:hypothetical protein n=1 Tax=Mucilaginibacter sp. E4BP6 TaxID=2723089 RepID=UPI0015CCD372|nr:hypothetical protein [Mucilaginibacter sp. E4BP6]NYE64468.1 hypothetical protein [Mucilaginibacter sp. E4BP6]
MKIEQATKDRIVRNVILSLFIYLLPVALLFITLKITGQRPWEKKTQKAENTKSLTNKTNLNNGSND